MVYGLLSDPHAHSWSAFASIDDQGRNSRLMGIIAEINNCFRETMSLGGDTGIIGGDLFHHRGSVDPRVFNPIKDCFTAWTKVGFKIIGIAGNHDLGSRESEELSSSVAMLNGIEGVSISHTTHIDDHTRTILVPWHSKPAEYMEAMHKAVDDLRKKGGDPSEWDMICHIGIDGTLTGMPDHGVTADMIKKLGVHRVFSGHYHNHRNFGDGVFSIGALTHQNWGDVGTKAGYLIVGNDVKFRSSNQPSFVDMADARDELEAMDLADGNYVRVNIGEATPKEVEEHRKSIMKMNAAGVIVVHTPKSVESRRTGATAKTLDSLRKSVSDYCGEQSYSDDVKSACEEIMTKVGL